MTLPQEKWIALILGLSLFSRSLAVGAAPEAVTLIPGPDPIPLGRHAEYLRDDSGKLTLGDVRSSPATDQFAPSQSRTLNQGITDRVFWYRVAVRNAPKATTTDWVLELSAPLLDHVDVHIVRSDGAFETVLTGDRRQAPPQQLPHPDFALPLRLGSGEEVTLYLRVATAGQHQMPLLLSPAGVFQSKAAMSLLLRGCFYGVMLVMALYNLVIYLWIRDRAYLYYVLYVSAMIAASLVTSGLARQLGNDLFADAPDWINVGAAQFPKLMLLLAMLFGMEFLQTRQRMPRVHTLTKALVLFIIASVLLHPFVPYVLSIRTTFVSALGVIVLLFASLHLSLKGMRSARFYLLAWSLLIAAIVAFVLQSFGLLPASDLIRFSVPFAACLEAALLSLALADRINQERKEKFEARHEALAAKEQALVQQDRVNRLKSYLPQKVAELVVGGDKALLDAKRRQVTVCVIDLRGFTPFSETAAPEDVMNVLREFFTIMGGIVEKHGGTVEHFAGDSMLIFFNAPLEIPHPERQAIETALEMRAAFEKLQPKWKTLGYELGLGIGLANGYATIGAIGFLGRSQYAAIGAVTNLASRLCSSAKHGEILTTARVLAELDGLVESEAAGEQTIRGFTRPVQVVRVV